MPHYTTSPPRRRKPWHLPDSENQMSYSCDVVFLRKSETPLKTCRGDGQSCTQKCSEDEPKFNKDDLRPRRTSTSGMWSGLRMKINTFPEHIPPRHEPDQSAGVLVSRRTVIWSHISLIGATRLHLLTYDDTFHKTAGVLAIRYNDSLPHTSESWNISVEKPSGIYKNFRCLCQWTYWHLDMPFQKLACFCDWTYWHLSTHFQELQVSLWVE